MKHILTKFVTVAFVGLTILFGVAFSLTGSTYAEDNQGQEAEAPKPGTSISISPVSRIFQLVLALHTKMCLKLQMMAAIS